MKCAQTYPSVNKAVNIYKLAIVHWVGKKIEDLAYLN